MPGFTPRRCWRATEMVQSLCCQLWFKPSARGSCGPRFTGTAQRWLVQTSVGRFGGLACAELVFSSHAALLAPGRFQAGARSQATLAALS